MYTAASGFFSLEVIAGRSSLQEKVAFLEEGTL
jgi:hypothetical protein